jgi:hypothetical protein
MDPVNQDHVKFKKKISNFIIKSTEKDTLYLYKLLEKSSSMKWSLK